VPIHSDVPNDGLSELDGTTVASKAERIRRKGMRGPNMKPSRALPGDRHERMRSTLLPIALVAALVAIGASPAGAQQAVDQPRLQLSVTPYFWISHIDSRVKTPLAQEGTVTQTIDFDQLFNHLSWVPFMGSVEGRYDRYGVFVDYMHIPVRSGFSTHDVLFSGGSADLVLDVATVDFFYRPIAQPEQSLDVGVGVRPWGVATNLSFNAGLLPGQSVQPGGSWADPLIAARYHRELGSGFAFTVYGDVGGFGLAAHTDWQVVGTIDYALRSSIDLHLGYRSLNVNYSLSNRPVGFVENLNGPIIAGTFHF
jgi:hypothetical protein